MSTSQSARIPPNHASARRQCYTGHAADAAADAETGLNCSSPLVAIFTGICSPGLQPLGASIGDKTLNCQVPLPSVAGAADSPSQLEASCKSGLNSLGWGWRDRICRHTRDRTDLLAATHERSASFALECLRLTRRSHFFLEKPISAQV